MKLSEFLNKVNLSYLNNDQIKKLKELLLEYDALFTSKVKIAKVDAHCIRLKPNVERKKPFVYLI